jgi:hypothetical protein
MSAQKISAEQFHALRATFAAARASRAARIAASPKAVIAPTAAPTAWHEIVLEKIRGSWKRGKARINRLRLMLSLYRGN